MPEFDTLSSNRNKILLTRLVNISNNAMAGFLSLSEVLFSPFTSY